MSESQSVDEGWEESLDSEQVTHVKGELPPGITLTGEWLVNVSEQVVVPMTTTDVVEALRSHRISEHSLVWRAGMQDWTALAEVPPLRLAAGALLLPSRPGPAPVSRPSAARVSAAPVVQVTAHATERTLHPPPKAAARAARDERRRNTLPFGFPVVRDPATVREPKGLHSVPAPAAAPVARPAVGAASPAPPAEEVEALAIYERAAPSLTFSDSVRAEWQGTSHLLHQGPPSAPPAVMARPAPRTRPEPKRAEPLAETRPRLSLEPQSDPKPRLSLEPQSDPLQSRRPEPEHSAPSVQPPSSLAPTTSGLGHELPARDTSMWSDLNVVLTSDLRAVQATSKRVTVIASIGSALLASLLTLWFAHSSTQKPSESAPATQPVAVTATAHVAPPAPPSAEVAPPPAPVPTTSATQASAPRPSAPAVPHAAPKPAAPRVIARPKPVVTSDSEPAAPSLVPDSNPYADPSEVRPPKTPTAAFKEPPSPTAAPSTDSPTPKSAAPSGLEDSASPVRPTPTAAPGF